MVGQHADSGFTLVELLATLLVLGVLTTIALPAALHHREKAFRAVLAAELHAIRNAQAAWQSDEHAAATQDFADLALQGYRRSDGVEHAAVKATGHHYLACLKHASMSNWLVYDSQSGTSAYSPTNACA